jgi:acetyl esterase
VFRLCFSSLGILTSDSRLAMLTLAILAMALMPGTTCSKPTPTKPVDNYITPGGLRDVAYQDGLTLDAYAPEGPPRPAAVVVHGSYGDKRTHLTQLFEPLGRAGFAWFSVDYRTLKDVEEAIRFIRCPGRFNITSVVFLIGEDTGGEIALELAARGGFQGVATFGVKLSPQFTASVLGDSTQVRRSVPSVPVHMFHGTDDDESPLAQAQAICKEMPSCVFHAVPGGIHQFENWQPDKWFWKEDLTAWLRGDRPGLWKDIVYARPAGRDLLMDAYVPEGSGPFPAAIIVHGGGWEAGDKVTYVSPIFEPLARSRIAWFSIDYRLTPYARVPDQLDDVRSAIRYVRQHAARFQVDPNRLALIGESASGHLVTQVASEPCPDCKTQAVVSFYGVYNLTQWSHGEEWQRQALTRLLGDRTPEGAARYSPLEHVTSSLPPMLLIQGTKDELYQGTVEYAARLKEAGAHSELVLLEGAPHGMENWEGHPEWAFYKRKLIEWLWSVFERH